MFHFERGKCKRHILITHIPLLSSFYLFTFYRNKYLFCFSPTLLIITQINATVLRLGFAKISDVFLSFLRPLLFIISIWLHRVTSWQRNSSYLSSTKPNAENTVNKTNLPYNVSQVIESSFGFMESPRYSVLHSLFYFLKLII